MILWFGKYNVILTRNKKSQYHIMKKVFISALAFLALPLFAQKEASIRVYPQQGTQQISKHMNITGWTVSVRKRTARKW